MHLHKPRLNTIRADLASRIIILAHKSLIGWRKFTSPARQVYRRLVGFQERFNITQYARYRLAWFGRM